MRMQSMHHTKVSRAIVTYRMVMACFGRRDRASIMGMTMLAMTMESGMRWATVRSPFQATFGAEAGRCGRDPPAQTPAAIGKRSAAAKLEASV